MNKNIPDDVYTKLFILTETLASQNITIMPSLNSSVILSIKADNGKFFDFEFSNEFSPFNDYNQPHKVYCDGELIFEQF
jgi:hypothetical protein